MSQDQVGFNVFLTSLHTQIYKATGGAGVSKGKEEIQRMAEERWQMMSAEEKQPYLDYAEKERPQLGLEMPTTGGVTISTAEASSSGRKRKRQNKQVKDPNQPKRAITAFFFFALEERPKVRKANPGFKVTEVSKELGRMWAAMTAEEKDEFLKKAELDKIRYANEKKAYEESKQAGTDNAKEEAGSAAEEED